MCSIVMGYDTDKVRELARLNKSRGTHSHSVFYVHRETLEIPHLFKSLGELDVNSITIPENHIAIVHQQAPTTVAKTSTNVHPSHEELSYLWHNGILKSATCSDLQSRLGTTEEWDTRLLHLWIERDGDLNIIDGSLACIYLIEGSQLNVFRNQIAPMHFDGHSFSSTPFPGSSSIAADTFFDVDFTTDNVRLSAVGRFKTAHNPYYFGE
jgi:hypothetical protein